MDQWLHLPLVICRLGRDHAQLFAKSFRFVVLKKDWTKLPSELELKYANEFKNDIDNGNTNYFGLYNLLLQDNEFYEKFENFFYADNPKLYEFPKLYNIVRAHIYFIVIYQQQVEGLFNKLDLKTHVNMSLSLKESKLRLASDKTEH